MPGLQHLTRCGSSWGGTDDGGRSRGDVYRRGLGLASRTREDKLHASGFLILLWKKLFGICFAPIEIRTRASWLGYAFSVIYF